MDDRKADLARRNLLGVFGERDPVARAQAIQETYAPDVTFADPEGVVVGWEALNGKAQRLLDAAAGFVFRPAGPVRIARDLVALAWEFGPEGEAPVARGLDISIIKDDRIVALYTLLDPAAPPDAPA